MRLQLLLARLMLLLVLRVMPAHQRRKHFDPPWKGDRPAAIRRVRRGGAIDENFHVSKNGTMWAGHWGIPEHDNWHYIVGANGRVRRMSHAELHRPYSAWTDDQIVRWRRGPSAHSPRPYTYRELARMAARRGVTIYAEIKFHITLDQAQKFVADAHAAGHPPFAMAMLRQSPHAPTSICEEKCAAIVQAGGQFRVIYGKGSLGVRNRVIARRTFATWRVQPTARG